MQEEWLDLIVMEESNFFKDIESTLKQVLIDSTPLDPVVCRALLQEPATLSVDVTFPKAMDESFSPGLRLLTGYPTYPLSSRLVQTLSHWSTTGECPVYELPTMFMLNEGTALEARQKRFDDITHKLEGAPSLWDCWSDGEKKFFLMDILKMLGTRGVLDLLGVRETVGSSGLIPPPKEILLETFLKLHCPPSKLTVGARALAKHHHRDDTASWWGACTGSEEQKNAHALQKVLTIMSNATWINIHSLPHEVKVIEMRTIDGYGARWLLDGSEFRGFLEPQMVDGHDVGWRH